MAEDSLIIQEFTPEEFQQTQEVKEEVQEGAEDTQNEEQETPVAEEIPSQEEEEVISDEDQEVELAQEDVVLIVNEYLRSQGLAINSLEQIVDFYNKAQAAQNSKLTPEEWHRVKIARENNGDWSLYDTVKSIDTGLMSDKDKIKTQFLLQNKGEDQSFLSMKFEREWKKLYTYGEDDPEDEKLFIEKSIQSEARKAEAYIKEYQSKLQLDEGEQEEEVDTTENDKKWYAQVDGWIDEINQNKGGITFEIEDKAVNVDVSKAELENLRDSLDNPMGWFYSKIKGEDGQPDPELIRNFIIREELLSKIINELYTLGSVNSERKSLERASGKEPSGKTGGTPKPGSFTDSVISGINQNNW
jgi:hypothetical protein